MKDALIRITRYKESYDFRVDKRKRHSFENNWKNNGQDLLSFFAEGEEVFRARCQSVANYCFGNMRPGDSRDDGDTIAPGRFRLKCFVPPRAFHGEIHAVTCTRDLDGQWIDRDAMQTTADGFQNGRWLIHDRYSFKTGRDTSYAWSAGCIILSSGDLAAFNETLRSHNVQPGDLIEGQIEEV